eukprot:GFUD01010181.1.p3 GENE.GFUD01010181.1~~GFUD01010181.1.p3  ORF type:complete len:126 (+),score=46.86 GFUD01010181.1:79-456(+)
MVALRRVILALAKTRGDMGRVQEESMLVVMVVVDILVVSMMVDIMLVRVLVDMQGQEMVTEVKLKQDVAIADHSEEEDKGEVEPQEDMNLMVVGLIAMVEQMVGLIAMVEELGSLAILQWEVWVE